MEEPKAPSPAPLKTQESNSSQQANNPITRKLNKILESRIENDKVYLFFD
jgi:hypothetical protein